MSVFSFLLCLVAGSVFSCSDINTDAYIFASTSTLINSGTKNVRLLVSSNANLLSSSASRTIAPAAYDSAQLNFYLGGKNVGTGANLTIQQVDFVASEDSPSSGTIIVPLNSYNYQLVLLAVPKSTEVTISSNTYASSLAPLAVLAGTATADLRYNNDSEVNFYLSSNGLTGNGGYDIQFYLKNWSAASLNATDSENSDIRVVGNVSLELRTLSGDASVSGTEITGKSFASATSADTTISYTKSEIKAGTYDLCVTFSYNGKHFVYSDKIIILPYQTTTATIGIPDILQTVPVAPTEFKQGYVLPENDETSFYRVAFSWEDNSKTETNFELQLLDVSDSSLVTTETENTKEIWNSISASLITSYASDFEGGSNWYAGSLARNSTTAVFYLPLGKRYLARIRAVNNDVGGSEWCYASSGKFSVLLPAASATANSLVLSESETVSAKAFNTSVINIFRLTYNLVGGTFSSAIDKVYYFDQISSGIPILTPDGDSTNGSETYKKTPVSLTNGDLTWSYWAISSINGEAYPKFFAQCLSAASYNSAMTYYGQVKRTDKGLSETDINGSEYTYDVSDPQPTSFSNESNNYINYYVTNDSLTNYVGYKNLSLYAIYKKESSGATEADYSIHTNLTFSATANGVSCPIDNYMFTAPSTASTLRLGYTYETNTFAYDSISLTVREQGGSEIGIYSPISNDFHLPTNLDAGMYILTITATKSGTEFRTLFIMILE